MWSQIEELRKKKKSKKIRSESPISGVAAVTAVPDAGPTALESKAIEAPGEGHIDMVQKPTKPVTEGLVRSLRTAFCGKSRAC